MMNFQGFKKIGSDNKSTTFEHPNGSKLVVAHAKLDPSTLKKISKLPVHKACGGSVKGYSGEDADPEDQEVTPAAAPDTGDVSDTLANPAAAPPTGASGSFTPGASGSWTPPPPAAATAPATSSSDPMQQYMNTAAAGVNQEIGGAKQMAQAQSNQANQQADLAADQAKQIAYANQLQQKNLSDINAEYQNSLEDLKNGHIDPNHFQESQTSGQKVQTAIGLFLGGIGGALSHTGGNVAMDFLNKQIDRDIQSQQQNLGVKKTLLEANLRQYGNMNQAAAITRAQLQDYYSAKMTEAAQTYAGPQAMAKAQMFAGEVRQKNAMILGNVAAQKTQSQLASGGAPGAPGAGSEQAFLRQKQVMQMANPEYAKQMESMYLPGVGTTRVPVKPDDMTAMASYGELDNKLKDAIDFAQQKGTTLPLTTNNQQASDIQNGIQLEIGKLKGLNRINEFEANKYEQMVGNPGALRSQAAIQSFQDLRRDIAQHKQAEMQKLGVQPFSRPVSAQDAQAMQWARQNPQDPRAAAIMKKVGAR